GGVWRDEQVGVGALIGTTDAAAKLVQLRKAHAVGAINDDGVGARDVEAVFDDGGGNQNVGFVADKFQHHFFEFGFAHLPVAHDHARFRDQAVDHGGEG